jgi:hypothetical protein
MKNDFTLREKLLIKILCLIANIIGRNVEGFFSHNLSDITKDI